MLKAKVDGTMTSVSIPLKPSDRETCIEAYRQGIEMIVQGELRRVGQRWTLEEPRSIEVIPLTPVDAADGDLIERVY